MEALHPGHANRLLAYDTDPATPPQGVSVGQELSTWYWQDIHEILARPIVNTEIADIRLLFSSIDTPEVVALLGLWRAVKLADEPDKEQIYKQIDSALPVASAAIEGYEKTEQFINDHDALRRILRPEQGFLRSIVEISNSTANYRLSKGAVHTSALIDDSDGVFEVEEIQSSDIALLTAHEVLIRRLGLQNTARHTALPLEYSRTHRWLEGRHFSTIDAARQYIGDLASRGGTISNTNEPYQQGLLSILQSCSMFPDIIDCYRADDRAGFCAMLTKITQAWPTPGLHGAIGQGGFIFQRGSLRYEGGKVMVDEALTRALAELPDRHDKLHLRRDLQVPLYIGRRVTAACKPLGLPTSIQDCSPIPGTLAFYGGNPDEQTAHGRCPALAKYNGPSSRLVASISGQLYDQAKLIEPLCGDSDMRRELIVDLDMETIFRLLDTPKFRDKIPTEERDTWMDGNTDLIENGTFREPGYRETYLVETVNPLLLQLGRGVIEHLSRGPYGALIANGD